MDGGGGVARDLGGFDGGVLGDDARAGAGCVEEHAVEALAGVRESTRVHSGYNEVLYAKTSRVRNNCARSLPARVVRVDDA